MWQTQDHRDLRRAFDNRSGRMLPFPLVEAHLKSEVALDVLRASAKDIVPHVEQEFELRITLIAFGSLGRLEFVPAHSDLDLIIVFDRVGTAADVPDEAVRTAIVTPLALANPWLKLDDRELVVQADWNSISNVDLKYPVYTPDRLVNGGGALELQRRWQILLESRYLYGRELYESIYRRLYPRTGIRDNLDFLKLVQEVPDFFAYFENPQFLYKSAYKYWKTRIMREYYTFTNIINFVSGWFRQQRGPLQPFDFFRAPTTLKLLRLDSFADQFESQAIQNPTLQSYCANKMKDIFKRKDVTESRLYPYTSRYQTEVAKRFHGLMGRLLDRFSVCWERIYDEDIRAALNSIPAEAANFDAVYPMRIRNSALKQTVDEFQRTRKSYRKYMAATAEILDRVFVTDEIWTDQVPRWLNESLRPFQFSTPGL